MKKARKRILGFLALSLVAAMTTVAMMIPSPETSAVTSTITDVLQVRVVGSVPNVWFEEPTENLVVTKPGQRFKIAYENVTDARVALNYTGVDTTKSEDDLVSLSNLNYDAGAKVFYYDMEEFGYGKYVFSLFGVGFAGTEVPFDGVAFTYVPLIVDAVGQSETDGLIDVNIGSYTDDVDKVEIYIDGVLNDTLTRDELDEDPIKLIPEGLETGEHTIKFVAKDKDGKTLYLPVEKTFYYDYSIYVPDTGRFFQSLNISKEDYLVTGLIVFFVIGVVAFGIVARGNKKTERSRKRH